jgi:Zn-dependent protease with chaperone function
VGYLLHIVLALGALALAENGVLSGWELPFAVVLLAFVPHALAYLDRKLFLRGHFRVASALYAALNWSPPVLFAVALCGAGWSTTLTRWFGAAPSITGWPGPVVFVALVPYVAYTLLAIDARVRVGDSREHAIARARRFQTRMFFAGLAPLVLFIGAAWLIGTSATLRAHIEYVGLWGATFAALALAAAIAFLPWVLRNTWDTRPMPSGSTRELLERFASAAKFRCRELLVWNTGQQMANAAVVGVGANRRVVLFSDALLAQLPPRELLSVFAHEIGHVARHHVLSFIAWALALFIGLDVTLSKFVAGGEWVAYASLAGTLVVWYLGFGFLSRRAELEADLYSIELTGDLDGMIGALELVGSPHTRGITSWRHFSTEQRVAFLRRAALEPQIATRLKQRMRRVAWLGVALAVIAVGFELRELVRELPVDRVTVELALGANREAAAVLRALDDPDPDLTRLVECANSAPYESASPQQLREYADQARKHDALVTAFDLYTLARLRGVPDLADTLDELEPALRERESITLPTSAPERARRSKTPERP